MRKYKRKLLILGGLALLAAGLMFWQKQAVWANQPAIAGKILRFHVLANSDSEVDQAVKLKVRDAVGTAIAPYIQNANSREDAKAILWEQEELILQTAKETLEKEGYSYGASMRIANVDFPEKTYGEFVFPAGEYEALQLVLGEGEGQNWWCVLYPNLCFRGTMYEVVSNDSKEELREVLSAEEYWSVLEGGKYLWRFKCLEVFE